MVDDTSTITFVESAALSSEKWQRITASAGLYSDPAFLTAMAGNWAAFVYKDYEAVFPVFPNKKAGIHYLYQPGFLQKTAIYSIAPLQDSVLQLFLTACRKRFRFAEFQLANNPAGSTIYCRQRNNFLVNLQIPYSEIEAQYKTDLLKNRKIAAQYDFEYRKTENAARVIELYQQTYGKALQYKGNDYERLKRYCFSASGEQQVVIREIWQSETMQAACLCLKDQQRIYLLANVTVPDARKKAANHFLIDRLIREFSGQLNWLDMEGSDRPGIAHFYQNFGAINEPYYFIAWNDLPIPLRWLKPSY